MNIVTDVSQFVAPSKRTIQLAFQFNHTSIIKYIVSDCKNDEIQIDKELLSYPIMNGNLEILSFLKESGLWPNSIKPNLYYSAVLSGSIDMIKYVEQMFPDIHDNFALDLSQIERGQSSLLLNEMIYYKNSKKYFSHTITYAIQSGSIEIVKYIHSLGYGITQSNLVNAIRCGKEEIIKYIIDTLPPSYPPYLIYYLSFHSYLPSKKSVAKLLLDKGLGDIRTTNMTINDYKLQTAHLRMITDQRKIIMDLNYDPDYLMSYVDLFAPQTGYKLNLKLLTIFRILIETNGNYEHILNIKLNQTDRQLLTDVAFLLGKNHQIKKVFSHNRQMPNIHIVIEVLCQERIDKIRILLETFESIIPENLLDVIYQTCYVINTTHTTDLMNYIKNKHTTITLAPSVHTLIQIKQIDLLIEKLQQNQCMDSDLIYDLLRLSEEYPQLLDHISLLQNNFIQNNLAEILKWARSEDLRRVRTYLEQNTI